MHAMAAEELGDAQVVSVASRTPERATRIATRIGAAVHTYEELPGGADLVIVATPPSMHAKHALWMLERGAYVIVEKPLCRTLAEADALVSADPNGTRILYGENLAFAPAVRDAITLVRSMGETGRPLVHLQARALQQRPSWGDFLTAEWGGGVLFDLGVHPLALVLLAARPARAIAVRAHLQGAADVPVDVAAQVQVELDSGLTALVEASWCEAQPTWDLEAASDGGTVRLELMPHLLLERNGEGVETAVPPETRSGGQPRSRTRAGSRDGPPQVRAYGYTGQLQAAITSTRSARPMPVGVDLGREILDVVCAAYASASTGGDTVSLPFAGPRDRTPLQLWGR